ncbi:MAG: transporter substrate-binding domain-containing protein [Caldilineaceae bacterium]
MITLVCALLTSGSRKSPCIGVPQGDSYLRDMVNFTLQSIKQDGTYDAIYEKWFPVDQPYPIEISPGEWPYTLQDLPPLTQPEKQSKIQEIVQRGRLIAVMSPDVPQMGSQNTSGEWSGFDIDIVREFARRWLGSADAVEFVAEPDKDTSIQKITDGVADLMAGGIVMRRDWASRIDFSQSYLGPPVVSAPLGIGLPQQDTIFRELVNVTLQEMKIDGTYDSLFSTWFGPNQPAYALEVLPGDADYLLIPYRDSTVALNVKAATESTIERIRKRGNVVIAGVRTDLPPFGYMDSNGQVTGFDVDLIQALAAQWGITVEFVELNALDQVQKLALQEVDIVAAALQHTKDRESDIDFSQTYFVDGQAFMVRSDSGINDLSGLNNQNVAALQNSAAIDQFQAYADANGIQATVMAFPSYDSAIQALSSGQVSAIAANLVVLTQLQADSGFTILEQILEPEPYGLGLTSGDSYFNNLVNFTLQGIKQKGIYDALYQKWFGNDVTPYPVKVLPGIWPYTLADSPTTLDKPVRSKVEEIQARGKLIAGVPFDLKPFGFLDAESQISGFDVDLMHEFAKRWLGDADSIEFVPVTAANRIDILVAGQIDMVAAAMTHRRDRDELIDFSQTYFEDGQSLLVRQGSGIQNLRDLNGKVIAAIQGSGAIENMQSAANQLGISFDILPFQEHPQALEALKAGQVDALTTGIAALTHFTQDNSGLEVVGGRFTSEPYGLGIPNYDDRFQDLVNFTLQEMMLDGTYDRLYQKWFSPAAQFAVEVWPGDSYLDIELAPMVRIPSSEYVRGNSAGFPDEKFEKIIFVDEFYIDQYEVTNRQYNQCVQAGRCTLPRLPKPVNFGRYYTGAEYGDYPVVWVSWEDAAAYCSFVGKRLPTEAEWEKAARGPNNTLYPWGDTEPVDQANYNYVYKDVAPVGLFSADTSGYGVSDMAGNVREWVADWYQWDYYLSAPSQNPTGPNSGATKVLRGGSWNDAAVYLRGTVRKNFLQESYDSNLGFRCASSTFPPSR